MHLLFIFYKDYKKKKNIKTYILYIILKQFKHNRNKMENREYNF